MPSEPFLRFGVEVEIILTARELKDNMARYELLGSIAKGHGEAFNRTDDLKMRAPTNSDEDHDMTNKPEYDIWRLISDGTIFVDDPKNDFALELASPILTFDTQGTWRDHVRKAFCSVEDVACIKSNVSCGTHLHVSPGTGDSWTGDELKEICHAILFFEGAFLKLVPESRRVNENCKSNGLDTKHGESPEECWQNISAMSREALIRSMSVLLDRFYGWNFNNLIPGPGSAHRNRYTIEWRLPPGVKTAEGCLMWAELALNFIQAARQPGAHMMLMDSDKRTVEYLREFVDKYRDKHASDSRYLDAVFLDNAGRISPVAASFTIGKRDQDKEVKVQQFMLEKLRREDNSWAKCSRRQEQCRK